MSRFKVVAAYCVAIFGLVAIASLPTPSQAETGSVRIVVTKAGFIVGVGGGQGTLTFEGHHYPLSIGGVSVGATIGASKTDLVGHAYNMRHPADIAGTYSAIGGGVAIAAGAGSVRLQNSKGVILELHGRKVGLEFSINLSGMEVSLR
jgi:hypothetical protein